ncbi:hypothetical protein DVA81_19725, partial [Acinetobacter baumannii]
EKLLKVIPVYQDVPWKQEEARVHHKKNKPANGDASLEDWESENLMIMSWSLYSMEPSISMSLMTSKMVKCGMCWHNDTL